jgi:hypothetical protein
LALRGQPGVIARDIVRAQPITWQPPVDPDVDMGQWVASGPAIEVYPRKIGSGESYREGKQDQTLSYTLYADHRRGSTFPVGEKDRIWLAEAGQRKPDGTPDYQTALEVQSVVLYNDEGVGVIEAGRTY